MADRCGEFSFFKGIHVTIDLIIHFYKTYDHQIRQEGTFTGFDSNETNQAGAGDIITSTASDRLKSSYAYYHSAYGHQTWQENNLP